MRFSFLLPFLPVFPTSVSSSVKMSRNPTPAKTSTSASWFVPVKNAICYACGLDEGKEQTITCDKCLSPLQLSCTKVPDYELVKYFKKNLYRRKFVCETCIRKIHPKDLQKITQLRQHTANITNTEEACKSEEDSEDEDEEHHSTVQEENKEIEVLEDDEEEMKKVLHKDIKDIIREETKIMRLSMMQDVNNKFRKMEAVQIAMEKQLHEVQPQAESRVEAQTQIRPNNQEEEEEEEEEREEEEEAEDDEEEKQQQQAFYNEIRKMIKEETKEVFERLKKIEDSCKEKSDTNTQPASSNEAQQRPEIRPLPAGRPRPPQFRRPPPLRRPLPRPMPPPMRRPPPQCFNCGKWGHIARDCYWQSRQPISMQRPGRRPPFNPGPMRQFYQPPPQRNNNQERFRTMQTTTENGGIKIIPLNHQQQQNTDSLPQQYQQQYRQPPPTQNGPFFASIPPMYF